MTTLYIYIYIYIYIYNFVTQPKSLFKIKNSSRQIPNCLSTTATFPTHRYSYIR